MTTPPVAAAVRVPPWRGLDQVPESWGPSVVTLGVFDGVHRGHARLIERAVRLGRFRGLPTVLVTFDPHPARVVAEILDDTSPRDTAALSTVERRAELAAALGVDAVCVLRFTRELASVTAEEFVERVLVDTLRAAAVVVGANFTFGHRGAGDVDTLHRLGKRHGFTADGVALLQAVDAPCSSTHVRACLRRGDVRAAAFALGRPHRVEGTLAGGQVTVAEDTALPASGRYVGLLDAHLIELEVTADGRLLVHPPGQVGRPGVAEFLDRVGTS
jgi:riboflavin kinase/FMN adenylyltransferase